VLFLAISTFLEFLSVLLYAFLFPRLPIVKYYRAKAASEGSKTVSADLAAAGILKPENQEVLHFPFNVFTWSVWCSKKFVSDP
jgi:equilibrative nucleoside transporter 1/2/3